MKTIKTGLTEKQFEARLHSLCVEYKYFSGKYSGGDCFAAQYSRGKLRLMFHVKHVGKRDGYDINMLYARVAAGGDGKVVVRYTPGKPVLFTVTMIVWNIVTVPIFVYTIWGALWNGHADIPDMAITGVLSAVGLFLLFVRSKKSISQLENRLRRICRV